MDFERNHRKTVHLEDGHCTRIIKINRYSPAISFCRLAGRLSENNRWVQLSYLIPLRRVEQEYSKQQREMYRFRNHRVDDRIVSIAQPDVRPIVRGKAKANVEFGAKVAISVVGGYAMMARTSWDSFNEGSGLAVSDILARMIFVRWRRKGEPVSR